METTALSEEPDFLPKPKKVSAFRLFQFDALFKSNAIEIILIHFLIDFFSISLYCDIHRSHEIVLDDPVFFADISFQI